MRANRLLFLAAGVIALAASCQRESAVPDNPTYDPLQNTVGTKFYLNVSTSAETKTTANYAQLNGNFLGMEAVHLLTFSTPDGYKPGGNLPPNDKFVFNPFTGIGATDKLAATKDYDLGALMSAGDLTSTNQTRIVELALPLNTDVVAIYGKAYKDKSVSANDNQGSVTTTGDPTDLMTLRFAMTPRTKQEDAFDGAAFMFSRMLNGLIVTGLVNESNFALNPIDGTNVSISTVATQPVDRSFHFWWPTGFDPTQNNLLVNESGYTTDNHGNPLGNGYKVTVSGTEYTYHTGQLSWKQLGEAYELGLDKNATPDQKQKALYNLVTKESMGLTLVPLLEDLGAAYSALTDIKAAGNLKELRAGSATSILKTIEDLYAVINKVASKGNPTSWGEKIAIDMAIEIRRRIGLFCDPTGFSYQGFASVKGALQNCTPSDDWTAMSQKIAEVTADFIGADNTTKGEGGFPECIGLPKGAACLSITHYSPGGYSSTTITDPDEFQVRRMVDIFSYLKDLPAYGMGSATFDIFNYVYPAELMYFGNSSIRTNDNAIPDGNWPLLTSEWVGSSLWTAQDSGWEFPGVVKSTTTSVGVKYPINYGSALCHSIIKYKDNLTKLEDNRKGLFPNENANVITVVGSDVNTGFDVSGIIIGGQPGAVGWDYTICADGYDASTYGFNGVFTGLTYTNTLFNKMIYDKVSPNIRIGSASHDVYTFCFDNYNPVATEANQSDVYVALELVNKTGKDFWGELNLVRKDATFYIVGKIDMNALINYSTLAAADDPRTPSAASKARYDAIKTELAGYNSNETGYHYPPFDPATGETIAIPRVFMQDYMSEIRLILGPDALKHAYVTVPDLSASQVSLGLSVDITWKKGLEFDVDMGTIN